MKKIVLVLSILGTFLTNLQGQSVAYSESFSSGSTYCPGSSQWDNWKLFYGSLDTTSKRFVKVNASGTYNTTGYTCTDPYITRRLAQALYTKVAYNASCDGYVWTVGNAGSCTANSCGTSSDQVELTVNSTSALCSCAATVSFNPLIANANWGTVNAGNCNPPSQTMTLRFFLPDKNNDAGVSKFTKVDICTNTQALNATITNFGKKRLDSFRLYWSINGTLQTPRYITSKLKTQGDTVISMNSAFVFTNNTKYTFKLWTSKPNGAAIDSIAANDTSNLVVDFLGNPSPATASDFKQCGVGRPLLNATPASSSDTIQWYDAAVGGKYLGQGKSFLGPFIRSTTTFYAQAMRFSAAAKLNNGFTGVNYYAVPYSGGMVNITANSGMMMDSIMFRTQSFNANTTCEVYYKVGTYAGFTTNASAWTQLFAGKGRNFISGGQYFCKISANQFALAAGQVYGFYITTSPTGGTNYAIAKPSGVGVSNADLTIQGGTLIANLFGTSGTATNYTIDLEITTRKTCANPNRTAQKVTVNPRPIGSDLVKGSTFQGQLKVGSVAQPDITSPGQVLKYEMTPPTGYTNANHGSKWFINGADVRTKSGQVVPTTEYSLVSPTSTSNAIFTLNPSSNLCDSLVTFKITFFDFGPYYCDSTVVRTVKVAPMPKADFTSPTIMCDGDAILFNNTTTIGCGVNKDGIGSYKWYFGDGDSADVTNPVHQFAAYGCYNVRLVTTSFPWNVVKDTTIIVCIAEVPTVKFKVTNACEGSAVKFANQTTIGSGSLSYLWDFGDNTATTSVANPSHIYTKAGGYRVTLKVSSNGCVSSLTKNAYEFAKPVPAFTIPLAPVCAQSEILFPNSSTISLGETGSYWSYGDGKYSTLDQGYNTYATAGTYNVKLKSVSEFGCSDSISKQVVIKATPVPTFIYNKLCSGQPTNLINTTVEVGGNPTYAWTLSDNTSYSTKDVTKTWASEGEYTATLKVDFTNGCSASATKKFAVLIQPKAGFTVQDICSGELANFVNQTKGDKGNIKYVWDLGNGSSTDAAPKRLYNPAITTTYTVSLVASYAAGCSDTTSGTITVSQAPTCDFSFQNLGFLGYKFTPANSTYKNYDWFFGEGGSKISTTSPAYNYQYAGNFKVKMIATNAAGCQCEVTKLVNANLGVNGIKANTNVNIYPNPNNGTFTISNSNNDGMKIEVYNVLGSKVLSQTTTEDSTIINLGEVAKGIYLVKVTINGVVSTTKITVTN